MKCFSGSERTGNVIPVNWRHLYPAKKIRYCNNDTRISNKIIVRIWKIQSESVTKICRMFFLLIIPKTFRSTQFLYLLWSPCKSGPHLLIWRQTLTCYRKRHARDRNRRVIRKTCNLHAIVFRIFVIGWRVKISPTNFKNRTGIWTKLLIRRPQTRTLQNNLRTAGIF